MLILNKMSIFNVISCALVLFYIEHVYGFKDCSDCVIFTSCPNALKMATTQKTPATQEKFRGSLCGSEVMYLNVNKNPFTVVKVCCSDFSDYVENFETTITEDAIEKHPNVHLLPKSCGDIDGHRIIGGNIAKLNEFPWMALIAHKTRNNDREYSCSGTIINSKYILTAGHCVKKKHIIEVTIGEYDRSGDRICQDQRLLIFCEGDLQNIAVENKILHPNYQKYDKDDIALLRLRNSINFEFKNAHPICLPVTQKLTNVVLANKTGTIAGWGRTENSYSSNVLLKAEIPIYSAEFCSSFMDDGSSTDKSVSKEFCAGGNNKDSCNGDSGGPLMIEGVYDGGERYIQYGIVSSGPKYCGTDPGIYTDVPKYMKWILDNIKN